MRRGLPGQKQREIQTLVDGSSLSERAVIREKFEEYLKDCQHTQQSRRLTYEEKEHADIAVEILARIDTTNLGKGGMYRFVRKLGLCSIYDVDPD